MLSRYAPSLVSKPRDQMSRFVIRVSDLVKEECRMAMIHDDMTLSRLIAYAQSIKESKLGRICRNMKISESNDQSQHMIKKNV